MFTKKTKTLVLLALGFVYTTTAFADQDHPAVAETENNTNVIEETVGIKPNKGGFVETLYNEAVDWLKTPYRYGGNSRKGIDCSAFTGTIYDKVYGVKLNRRSKDISAQDVEEVAQDELKPGDLVFFATSRRKKGVTHVGIYLGNRYFVHASVRKGVTISSLDEPYYNRTFVKGGEVKDIDRSLIDDLNIQLENVQIKPLFVESKLEIPTSVTQSTEVLLKQIPTSVITE